MKPKQKLKILFVADPLQNFDYRRETSLFIMHEAARRGHRIYATEPSRLSAKGAEVWASSTEIEILGFNRSHWYKTIRASKKELRFFDAVLLRKDPPFDLDYLHHLYLLNLAATDIYMMNHPQGILLANEKLWPMGLGLNIPETVVSAEREVLLKFIEKNQRVIIKPIGSSGGRGIFLILGIEDSNLEVVLETATLGYRRHVIVQTYLPQVQQGDKRILILGGEILGAFIRKPATGQHRANLHAGGSLHPTQLNATDRECVERLRPHLSRLGLDFVGIDLIGDFLTEINVTSPMGLNEANRTSGGKTQARLVDYLESRVKNRHSGS